MSEGPGSALGTETSFAKLREALAKVHDESRQAEAEVRQWVSRYEQAKKMVAAAKSVLKPADPAQTKTVEPEPAQRAPAPPAPVQAEAAKPAPKPVPEEWRRFAPPQDAPPEDVPQDAPRAEPAPHEQPRRKHFCTGCGRELRPGALFCGGCGRKTAVRKSGPPVRPTPAESPEQYREISPPPVVSREQYREISPPVSMDWDQEPPPPPPPSSGGAPAFGEPAYADAGESYDEVADHRVAAVARPIATDGELPPPVEPWAFRATTTDAARRIVAGAGHVGTGPINQNLFRRVVRATFLDTAVYREVARDPGLQIESWQVALVVIVASSAGSQILTLQFFSLPQILQLVSTAAVHIVAWLARVWVVQFAAATWLDRKLEFHPLFRALAYAQGPAALTLVPLVGPVLALWALVTSTAAVQDVIGCDTKTAVILAVIGAIGVVAAIALAGPLVRMFV